MNEHPKTILRDINGTCYRTYLYIYQAYNRLKYTQKIDMQDDKYT